MTQIKEKIGSKVFDNSKNEKITLKDRASERIKRFRKRLLKQKPFISIQRAKYYTEGWKKFSNAPNIIRVAKSMRKVYKKMNLNIDKDDRIVGSWTEYFLGIPIDIERGLFNRVFEIELSKWKMKKYSIKSNLKFALHKIKKDGLKSLIDDLKFSSEIGAAMPSLGTDTLDKRKINPYKIKNVDKKYLLNDLIPYWKNKTIADLLQKEFKEKGIYPGEFGEFIEYLPLGTAQNDAVIASGAALGVWQGHLILDHEKPLKKGLIGMINEIENKLKQENLTDNEEVFLSAIKISLEGLKIYSERLSQKVKDVYLNEKNSKLKEKFREIYNVTKNVPLHPAKTFKEAIQSYWTIKTAVELAVPFNVHAPGRLDQLFFPYYQNDLENERITENEARKLLEELFLKIMSHNMRPYSNASGVYSQRYEGSEPVTLGGLDAENNDVTNDLTYLMLEAADYSKASLNFAVRIHENSPKRLWEKVAELHYHGLSSISLMNDKIAVKALLNRGFSSEDARTYAITGCVDMCSPGKTGGEGFSSLLLCRTLDMTLRNGNSQTLIGLVKDVGMKTGNPDDFRSFDEFLNAFFTQTDFMIKKIVDASTIRDSLYAENLPAPLISAFMNGCLNSLRDITKGGAIYDCEGILFMTSIANTVDSLYVIKKLIYEQRKFNFKNLLAAIDHNFSGEYQPILDMIKEIDKEKWGNGNSECDDLARLVTERMFKETYKYETYKNGFYAPFINSMTTHTYDGRISIATPDGRLAGKPYAASCNPYNVEHFGPTGVLKSVASINYEHVLGCAVNIRMHPTGVGKTEKARQKWISLIKTYFNLGGEQIQPTIVSTEVLRAAQENPEDYQTIIVKVGGYSAYFVDLGKEIQNEIISRTEHSE